MRPTTKRSGNETKARRRQSSAPAPAGEEPPNSEPRKSEPPKSEPCKCEPPKSEPHKSEPPRSEPLRSQNELRLSAVRKLAIVLDGWRACPERVCRRRRGCASPRLTCLQSKPARPLSPEQRTALVAQFQRDLRRALARRAAAV